MADSLSLITAQITFLEPQLALVHIPIAYYSFFLQPILRLLFGEDHDEDAAKIPWTNRHDFLNISITPVEVSIICSRELATRYIVPVQNTLNSLLGQQNSIDEFVESVREDYTVIQVDGQGLDAGQRVLELTGPLAMAGISIFFVTTYFSDYILVPTRTRRTVTTALEQRGFVFSKAADAFVSQLSPALYQGHGRNESSSSNSSGWSPSNSRPTTASAPTTPPARNIDELQIRTFNKLRNYKIKPQASSTLRLVNCAGSRELDAESDARFKNDLLQVLLATTPDSHSTGDTSLQGLYISNASSEDNGADTGQLSCSARFLSITLTMSEPASILFEEHLLPRLGSSLLGAKETADVLVPIIFDLRSMGFETTGIVGGVAGRLSQAYPNKQLGFPTDDEVSPTSADSEVQGGPMEKAGRTDPLEINFLSTAKSGTVIVRASQLERALKELERGYQDLG